MTNCFQFCFKFAFNSILRRYAKARRDAAAKLPATVSKGPIG
jgi:hypothetical protein